MIDYKHVTSKLVVFRCWMLSHICRAANQICFSSFRIGILDIASQTLQWRLLKADKNIFTFVSIILRSPRNFSKNVILWLQRNTKTYFKWFLKYLKIKLVSPFLKKVLLSKTNKQIESKHCVSGKIVNIIVSHYDLLNSIQKIKNTVYLLFVLSTVVRV